MNQNEFFYQKENFLVQGSYLLISINYSTYRSIWQRICVYGADLYNLTSHVCLYKPHRKPGQVEVEQKLRLVVAQMNKYNTLITNLLNNIQFYVRQEPFTGSSAKPGECWWQRQGRNRSNSVRTWCFVEATAEEPSDAD